MTFFWYDYETWGKNPHRDRIVQFGGVRTDEDLEQISEPMELKCQTGWDTLVGPGAVNVHRIMPTEADNSGVIESEFAARIHTELSRAGTCSVAYNGMSFDHEFTRVLFYRNLRDPYEWAWKNRNSYWDTLELMRAAFLFQPGALKNWPKKEDGRPSFRLEDLAKANLTSEELEMSHDAKTDPIHMWKVAKLIRKRARGLWDYALQLRDKKNIQTLMSRGEPVFHVVGGKMTTSRYCSTFLSELGVSERDANKTFAFDLFHDPDLFLKPYQQWTLEDKSNAGRLIFSFKHNKAPFVCKWSYLKNLLSSERSFEDILSRMQLKEEDVQARHEKIQEFINQGENPFTHYIRETESRYGSSSRDVDPDEAIYEGFILDHDRNLMNRILREGSKFDWRTVESEDSRIEPLIFRYFARNFPDTLEEGEKERWKAYCRKRQYEDKQRRWITADQVFSYELRDSTEPLGNLSESQAKQLVKWQDQVRKVLQ